MRYIISLSLLSLVILSSCKKRITSNPVSGCIEIKIDDFKTYSCQTGAGVKQYSFQNKIVYSFNLGSCGADLPTDIYDNDCNMLGTLGGITGNTKINGAEFSTAIYLQTIWQR